MAVSRGLRRLLHVLEIEEEQHKARMESALHDLRQIELDLEAGQARGREGRRLIAASAASGELPERLAGLEESRAALYAIAALRPKIAEKETEVQARRREFLGKRTARRQAQAVIEKAESLEAVEAVRRGQREQDDWFLARKRRTAGTEATPGDRDGASNQSR